MAGSVASRRDIGLEDPAGINVAIQRVCVWCGPATMLALFGGLLLAGFVPPPSPMAGAGEIAQLYQQNPFRIRLGLFIALLGGSGLYFPFLAEIFVQIRRIEGPSAPMSYTMLISGAAFGLLFGLVLMGMAAAAFRPGARSADSVLLLNDLSWLAMLGIAVPAVVASLALGVCVLSDRQAEPVLPRWVGYFNIWCAALFFPGTLDIFFTNGPFAFDGLFVFWIPGVLFGAWFLVVARALLDAISRQQVALTEAQRTEKSTIGAD